MLILNVLIFAGVYYQRDKTRLEVKTLQKQYQQRSGHQQSFDPIKHAHYHLGHSQSANVIVDVENHDTGALMEKSPHICSNTMQINVMKSNSPAQTTTTTTKLPMANNTTYKPRTEHVTIPIKNQQQQQQQQQQQTFARNETSFNNNAGMMTLPKQNTVHIPMSYNRNECMTTMTLPRNNNLNNSSGNYMN